MGLQGPSGSGKTYSALLLAYGLSGNWESIAVIDTENHSAELYSHLGPFQVVNLTNPFSPERYIEAIDLCIKSGIEVVIIDSISHEWEFLLDYHASLHGNSFTNWAKVTPRQNAFVQKLLQSPIHVISTIRTKQDYVLSEKNGKMVPEKVGLKSVQRDGLDYEFSLVFDLDIKNYASASKDRTGLFNGMPEFKITTETGVTINNWCNEGAEISVEDVSNRVGDTRSLPELLTLYKEFPQFQEALKSEFEAQKRRLLINQEVSRQLKSEPSLNGLDHP
jgi:hypothetical protein